MKRIFLLSFICILTFSTSFSNDLTNDTIPAAQQAQQTFDPNAAAQEYLNTLTPEQKEKSDTYFEGGYWLNFCEFLLEIIIAWIFLSLGLSRWIKNKAEKVKRVNIQNFIYIALYFIFSYILTFPLNVYRGFFREHHYGLSNMNFASWFGDEMKSLIITILFTGIFITILYTIIHKVKQNWWIWGTGLTIVFMIFSILIAPVFIAPLFNEYKPLENKVVKDEILSMSRANGVPADNVYEFDASRQSDRISANVSGIGSTIRVSLNDNLLNQCTPAEIKAVMGHELGHYVLNHIYKMIVYFSIIIFICFAFVNWAFKKLIVRFKTKWAISGINDIVGFPLMVILFSSFFFIAKPIFNNISRTDEIEADYFGLNTAREPDAFASVAMKLSTYRKIAPGRLEEIIFYDHPSGKTRVLNAMKWKAEHLDDN